MSGCHVYQVAKNKYSDIEGACGDEGYKGTFVASQHRKKVLRKLRENAGFRVIFSPPYLPDFNPIEKVWANLKAFIKN